jgi:hypothetical protein
VSSPPDFGGATENPPPGKLDEAIALYKSAESEWKQKKGFVRACLLTDGTSGRGSYRSMIVRRVRGWSGDAYPSIHHDDGSGQLGRGTRGNGLTAGLHPVDR